MRIAISDTFLHQIHAVDLAPSHVLDALISTVTNERVASLEKLVRGYANQVYRATTNSGRTLIVRIPFNDRSFDAEATAMRHARAAGAPVPEILPLHPLQLFVVYARRWCWRPQQGVHSLRSSQG